MLNKKLTWTIAILTIIIATTTIFIYKTNAETQESTEGRSSSKIHTYLQPESTLYFTDYSLKGTEVYINDTHTFMSVNPHTITHDGNVTYTIKSYQQNGSIDIYFGFDTEYIKPKNGYYINISQQNMTETLSYTIQDLINWTNTEEPCNIGTIESTIHKKIWINTTPINTTTICFNQYNSTTKTIYWNQTTQNTIETPIKIKNGEFNTTYYQYDTVKKWYYLKNYTIQALKEYKFKAFLDIQPSTPKGIYKYWFCIKPTSKGLQEAIDDEQLYCIDPWIDAGSTGIWYKKLNITINTTQNATLYPIRINLTYQTGMETDFADIRFLNEEEDAELDYYIWNYSDSNWADVTIELDSIDTGNGIQAWLYYNATEVNTTSNGTNTYPILFDDFNRPNSATVGNSWLETTASILNGSLYGTDTSPVNHSITMNSNMLIEWKGKVIPTAGKTNDELFGQVYGNENNQRLGISIRPPVTARGFRLLYSGVGWTSSVGAPAYNTWYKLHLKWMEADSHMNISYNDGSEHYGAINVHGYTSSQHGFFWFKGNEAGQQYQVDYIYATKYMGTEPTYSFGNPINLSSCVYPGTGNWTIFCQENCIIGDTKDLTNHTLNLQGDAGSLTINASGELIVQQFRFTPSDLDQDCRFIVLSGGKYQIKP